MLLLDTNILVDVLRGEAMAVATSLVSRKPGATSLRIRLPITTGTLPNTHRDVPPPGC